MADDPKDVRLPFMVTKTEAEAIDEWRYAHKIPTRAEAMRRLIRCGFVHDAAMERLLRLAKEGKVPASVVQEINAIAEHWELVLSGGRGHNS